MTKRLRVSRFLTNVKHFSERQRERLKRLLLRPPKPVINSSIYDTFEGTGNLTDHKPQAGLGWAPGFGTSGTFRTADQPYSCVPVLDNGKWLVDPNIGGFRDGFNLTIIDSQSYWAEATFDVVSDASMNYDVRVYGAIGDAPANFNDGDSRFIDPGLHVGPITATQFYGCQNGTYGDQPRVGADRLAVGSHVLRLEVRPNDDGVSGKGTLLLDGNPVLEIAINTLPAQSYVGCGAKTAAGATITKFEAGRL
jgi:hypothetical protein